MVTKIPHSYPLMGAVMYLSIYVVNSAARVVGRRRDLLHSRHHLVGEKLMQVDQPWGCVTFPIEPYRESTAA